MGQSQAGIGWNPIEKVLDIRVQLIISCIRLGNSELYAVLLPDHWTAWNVIEVNLSATAFMHLVVVIWSFAHLPHITWITRACILSIPRHRANDRVCAREIDIQVAHFVGHAGQCLERSTPHESVYIPKMLIMVRLSGANDVHILGVLQNVAVLRQFCWLNRWAQFDGTG